MEANRSRAVAKRASPPLTYSKTRQKRLKEILVAEEKVLERRNADVWKKQIQMLNTALEKIDRDALWRKSFI